MKIYYAPMEGVTGVNYRRVADAYYPDVDAYYAPFLQPNRKKVLAPKEKRDILPENNDGIVLVPQVLTCAPEGFLRAVEALASYGYQEINLNLGCPSGTVVSKGKGAGMLEDPEKLDAFLDHIFSKELPCKVSIKTRLGFDRNEDEDVRMRELEDLFALYPKYPITKLILHARYRSDYYRGTPRLAEFRQAARLMAGSGVELCYNGDILSKEDYEALENADFASSIDSVMIGRGLLRNPALVREIRGGTKLQLAELKTYMDAVYHMYQSKDLGERNTLFKMKELWNHWGLLFPEYESENKKVRKAKSYGEYDTAVAGVIRRAERDNWKLPMIHGIEIGE